MYTPGRGVAMGGFIFLATALPGMVTNRLTVYIVLQWVCGLSLPFSEHTNTGWIYLVVALEFELIDESTMQAQLQSKNISRLISTTKIFVSQLWLLLSRHSQGVSCLKQLAKH